MTDGLQRQGVGQPAACEELGPSEPENWTVDANLLMRTVCFITYVSQGRNHFKVGRNRF